MEMMERINMGLLYTGMGMLIVFAVLIILMVVIMLMKLFTKEETETSAPSAAPAQAPAPATAAIDTNETIAVISATVAAMSGDDPNKRLRVKSIKDQSGNVIWSK